MDNAGFWSVIPPLLTLVLAIACKDVIFALVSGILSGVFIVAVQTGNWGYLFTGLADKIADYAAKGQVSRPLRVMILGIPNVGKSTFINKVAKRKAAVAGDKPGVTRGKQWISIDRGLDLLDTPGILWPKFDSQEVGEMLAITNAIKADVLDKETLGANFMLRLREMYPDALTQRYKFVPDPEMNGYELLEEAAKKRGFLVSKGEYDIERMANTLLGEYHDGKLGRISLEKPE